MQKVKRTKKLKTMARRHLTISEAVRGKGIYTSKFWKNRKLYISEKK